MSDDSASGLSRFLAGVARVPSRSEHVEVRGLRYHVRHWGRDDAPLVIMLHGWMDVGASFQFVVDAMQGDRHVVAPDWRGYGASDRAPQGYWYPDYVADLDRLVDRYSPGAPASLVGHSLGGNVVMTYAGVRPERVGRAVSLEGFGLPEGHPDEAPRRYRQWLDGLHEGASLPTYRSLDGLVSRLLRDMPRLPPEHARFLASHRAARGDDGSWRLVADPAHRLPFPTVYRFAEAAAAWRQIGAPVLWMLGAESRMPASLGDGEVERRRALVADCRLCTIADAGHMLHLEQPEAVAAELERFLAD